MGSGSGDLSRLTGGANTPSPALTPYRPQKIDPYSGSGRNMSNEYNDNDSGRNVQLGDAYASIGERAAAIAWTDRTFRDHQR